MSTVFTAKATSVDGYITGPTLAWLGEHGK